MELKIDLTKERKKKSFINIVFGVFWLIIGILNFFSRKHLNPSDWAPSDWILIGCNALLSILFLIRGFWGYSFTLGKAYILIDSQSIMAKTKIWGKKQINWNDVKSIICDNEFGLFKIEKIDNKSMIIDLSEYNEVLVSKVEQAIDSIAKEKNILTNKTTK